MGMSESRVPERIERAVIIAAPVDQVWAVVTGAEHLGTWFGDAGAEVDLRPGGLLMIRYQEHGQFFGRVEKVEPPHLFSFRSAAAGHREPSPGYSTLVEFTLTPDGNSTRLHVAESGFPSLALSEEEKAKYVAGNIEGWSIELGHLQEYLQRLQA